ncbi:MAG: hypothetical protein HYV75_07120 [Opitutae bacterium]|nr:hypothetical protein [Opitutae bacterium]
MAALRTFCETRGFDPLLLPDLRPAEREANHSWRNPEFFSLVDRLLEPDRAELYRAYAFVLRPPTDDRPFFSQFLRWRELPRIATVFGRRLAPFFELGSLVVALTFVVLGVIALTGIVLPLVRLGWRGPGKIRLILYFGGLGVGFMLVEMGLMLRLQSWLGGAVPAAAVVLTSLLLFSGIGSLLSERWPADGNLARFIPGVIAGLIVMTTAIPAPTGNAVFALSAPTRIATVVMALLPLGLAMGMAFPLGLRRIAAARPDHVPWAWAVNGCMSVATPAGVMLLAMSAGYTAVSGCAVAAYTLAWLAAAARLAPARW